MRGYSAPLRGGSKDREGKRLSLQLFALPEFPRTIPFPLKVTFRRSRLSAVGVGSPYLSPEQNQPRIPRSAKSTKNLTSPNQRAKNFRYSLEIGFLLLSLFLLPPQGFSALLGDVDGDGRVTVQDARLVLHIVSRRRKTTVRARFLGDLWPPRTTGDGRISQEDVRLILRIAVGLQRSRELGPMVFTLAGSGPTQSQNPATTTDPNALFSPYDLTIGPQGEIYFTEEHAHRVRVLEPDGFIRNLAGDIQEGFIDGFAGSARFNHPEGIALHPEGFLVVADTFNHAIRKVTLQGEVTTIAGKGKRGYRDGAGQEALFNQPCGVATDRQGNLYVADTFNRRIRKIFPDGTVITLAGDGRPGLLDGPALEARFHTPSGVIVDPKDGSLYIADMGNNSIRKLTPDGLVITIAGAKHYGHVDGKGPEARFSIPYGVDLDAQGNLWIADWGNESVRILYPDGRVETVAGKLPQGYLDGPTYSAKFRGLMNVRVGPDGLIYLADTDNQRIRVIIP